MTRTATEEPTETEQQIANPEEFDVLDLDPQGWRPEPGTKLRGWVIDCSEIVSKFPQPGDETYPLVEVLTDDGELVNVHGFHTVMKSNLRRKNPRHGDRILLKYKGRLDKGGALDTGYHDYRLVIVPQDRIAIEDRSRMALPTPDEVADR